MAVSIPQINDCKLSSRTPIEGDTDTAMYTFSIWPYNRLKRAGVDYMEQLAELNRADLIELFGDDHLRYVDEVIDKLTFLGFQLTGN